MPRPELTVEQVRRIIPQASNVLELDKGGQKIVFVGTINNQKYALKFMAPNLFQSTDQNSETIDDVTARAQREVYTMQQCSTPHLVRVGPIGLQSCVIDNKPIIYFSEEFIEGKNLKQYLHEIGCLPVHELIRLAFHISDAIQTIWQYSKIHRDIKPSNIMRRKINGEYVLLDMGLVFDLQDESLSIAPIGTPLYFSPEQMDFTHRRTVMNFRSDLFSLGIVLYEMATGKHPFFTKSTTTSWEVLGNIANMIPEPPLSIRHDLPNNLNDIILRLLAKRPALRYRSIEHLQQALREVKSEGGGM